MMGFHSSTIRELSYYSPYNASTLYNTSIHAPCNVTIYSFVQNLTSSYTDQRNEASMVATSVLMFLLAALFFNLNLFSRLSDISAILNPSVRLFLSTSLSLFLPVMSYLFSEAKNEDAASTAISGQSVELSLRARTILIWMLLVELLRKKVEAILVTAGMGGYSGTIERAARITWLGILVFFNVKSAGRKATYGILWVLAAAKLVQRVVIMELGKRSFAYGKNAQLLTSYMAQMLRQERDRRDQEGNAAGSSNDSPSGSELLKMCNYAVMGEENLEKEAGPQGYHLELKKVIADNSTIVTVGKIWRLAENDQLLQGDADTRRLCLSFALYKLLRRRFEDLPITDAETRNCRCLIFKGLCNEGGTNTEATAVALFQVIYNELQFLCEYYHSVHPVVLSSPFFFLANYILFPITVWAFCVLTIVLCSNGDVTYALYSIRTDNNIRSSVSLTKAAGCLLSKIAVSPPAFFAVIDVSITILLLLTFLYEQVWEFVVFILSNWLMVSLICDYTAEHRWRDSPVLCGLIRRILWVRSKMSHPNLCFKQFSMLGFCRLFSLTLPTKAVPKEVKKSIMEYLLEHVDNDGLGGASASLSNGWCALAKHPQYHPQFSWACESNSVAEVILTWHIATSLLEVRCPPDKKETNLGSDHRKVATTLSKYCTYLVAFHPELLPDDKDGTERVYKAMKKDLKGAIGCWSYYLSPERTQYNKVLLMITDMQLMPPDHATTVVQNCALLGKTLIDEAAAEGNQEPVWKLLADLWTEIMVYVAPSSGEAHVKAHKEALVRGGEFLTVLWALATHTGITRPAVAPWEASASRAACV